MAHTQHQHLMGRGGEVSALRVDAAAKALDRATADGPFDDIAALNAIVTVKTGEAARAAAASGKPLAPEFSAVFERGQTVYFHRVKLMVGVYSSIAAWMISVGLRELGALPVLLMAGIMFVFYDYYSGVLHIVLDHPNHINLPIIGQGCLEFQWHHHIPDDIVSKSFLEVCGDLNVVVGLLAVTHYLYTSERGTKAVPLTLTGLKLVMAYWGQFSHRMAHTVHGRPAWVRRLQAQGLCVSFKDHHAHHTPPHNSNFCLLGLCNGLLEWTLKHVVSHPTVWLGLFLIVSALDIRCMTAVLEPLFQGQRIAASVV